MEHRPSGLRVADLERQMRQRGVRLAEAAEACHPRAIAPKLRKWAEQDARMCAESAAKTEQA